MNTPTFSGNQVIAYLIGGCCCGFLMGLATAVVLFDHGIIKQSTETIAPYSVTEART